MKSGLLFCLVLLSTWGVAKTNPIELGKVEWLRDMMEAERLAKESEKPIFILFQEVPGCITCQKYGSIVLSHPLIVEAIESLFVPLAIYNNLGGRDAEVLTYFKEPSWNNPVVRIVGQNKKNIIPRLSANYTAAGLVNYMIQALYLVGADIPEYLTLIRDELVAYQDGIENATFSMFCFWTGEKTFGNLEGVVHTEAGFMHNREVVHVSYDPEKISFDHLMKAGLASQCADQLFTDDQDQAQKAKINLGPDKVKKSASFRLDREPKYYLSKTPYRYIPMSPIQATKANALIGMGRDPKNLFSPSQLFLLQKLERINAKNRKNLIHDPDWQNEYWWLVKTHKV